jgi:hypothetical protein
MERQADPHRRLVARRQQQPVGSEVVEPDPLAAHCIEQDAEAARAQQLARQQMVTL